MTKSIFKRLALLAMLAGCAFGQTGTGSIQGTVQDPTSAAIPGAQVRAEHQASGRAFEAVSNQVGFYLFPPLPIGAYRLKVTAPDMQEWLGEVNLQVGQTAVVNPQLKVAGATVTVTVAGDVTAAVVTENATVGQTLEHSRVEQLPLNGRMLTTLISTTVPGLEGGWQIYGLRTAAFELVQDGATMTNREAGGAPGRPPGIDSIQELRVETNGSSARFNRPATALISTKSGTNKLHGALFETMRNNSIAVARSRSDFYTRAPKLIRNEFGASLGGPVVIPKLYNGRNRTFFFYAYEGYSRLTAATEATAVPTAAMREGDFSALYNSAGQAIRLYDPWTSGPAPNYSRTPFPDNRIPVSLKSPLASYLYSVTPLPTMPEVNPLTSSNWFGLTPTIQKQKTTTARLDHHISERDQIFLRATWGDVFNRSRAGGTLIPMDAASNVTYNPRVSENMVLSWNHTISPTFFSETMVSASYEIEKYYTGTPDVAHADILGLPNPFKAVGWPNIISTGFVDYKQGDNKRWSKYLISNLDQNFTKVAGRHELQFGGRYRYDRGHILPDQALVAGTTNFGSLATGLLDPKSGSAYSATNLTNFNGANFYLGISAYYTVAVTHPQMRWVAKEYSGYFQDNWKITPRLTLNLGLRYEYIPPYHEKNLLTTGFDMATRSVVNGQPLSKLFAMGATTPAIAKAFTDIGVKFATPDQVGLPQDLVYPYRKDFGPRVGFAYKLIGDSRPLVMRGGYAIYTFPTPTRNFYAEMRQNPPFHTGFSRNYNSAAETADGLPNYLLRAAPPAIAGVNTANEIDANHLTLTPGAFRVGYWDPNQPSTKAHEWNLTFEKEIYQGTSARVAYVGNHSSNLEQFELMNDAPPSDYVWFMKTGLPLPTGYYAATANRIFDQTTYSLIERYQKSGWGNVNAFQAELNRQFAKGYAFQFFYVMTNAFRAGGNGWREAFLTDPSVYLEGTVPKDRNAFNRFLNYQRDSSIPHHRFRWNWLVDVPVGRGKHFLGSANRILDAVAGGWQMAGTGTYRSRYFALPTTNWGEMGNVEVYGTNYPIQDCRSGKCIDGYLYYNGYIPANRINSSDAQGRPNGVMGVPDSYKPAGQPIFPYPKDPKATDPNYANYGTNYVWVTMKNGTQQRTTYNTGLHPWRQQYVSAPWVFGLDASLFKSFRITESAMLRFNADFFNVLNNPGLAAPDSATGILSRQFSNNGPRELQLTLRLIW